jgi:hypothetical protein
VSRFPPQARATIGVLADLLIPEAEGMPSATSVGVTEGLLDQVANFRSDIVPDLLRVVRNLGDAEPGFYLARLKEEDPEGFAALTLAVAGGYYLSAQVRNKLGYSGPERRPLVPGAPLDFEEMQLLRPVLERGATWRRVPAADRSVPGKDEPCRETYLG